MLVATTNQNQLLTFNARTDRIKTPGDHRPARRRDAARDRLPAEAGDLYGVGSDSVVYRVNPSTGIAIAEGPAFTPALSGKAFGVDFNPVVDKIRVVSDADRTCALNVDEGTVLMQDADLNPGMPQMSWPPATRTRRSASRSRPRRRCTWSTRRATRCSRRTRRTTARSLNPRKLPGSTSASTPASTSRARQHRLPVERGLRPRHRAVHGRRADRQDEVARPHRRRQAARGHRPRGLAGPDS